jgi:hypothetical protein
VFTAPLHSNVRCLQCRRLATGLNATIWFTWVGGGKVSKRDGVDHCFRKMWNKSWLMKVWSGMTLRDGVTASTCYGLHLAQGRRGNPAGSRRLLWSIDDSVMVHTGGVITWTPYWDMELANDPLHVHAYRDGHHHCGSWRSTHQIRISYTDVLMFFFVTDGTHVCGYFRK